MVSIKKLLLVRMVLVTDSQEESSETPIWKEIRMGFSLGKRLSEPQKILVLGIELRKVTLRCITMKAG